MSISMNSSLTSVYFDLDGARDLFCRGSFQYGLVHHLERRELLFVFH